MKLKNLLRLLALLFIVLVGQNCSNAFRTSSGKDSTTQNSGGTTTTAPSNISKVPPTQPELWYYHHNYLSSDPDGRVQKSKNLIDQAQSLGYTGLVFYDSFIGGWVVKSGSASQAMTDVINYAKSKGMKVIAPIMGFGWDDAFFAMDPNLAEGIPVLGTQFKVISSGSGRALEIIDSSPNLKNGGFESGTTGWGGDFSNFGGGGRISIDSTVFHSGTASAKITNSDTGSVNARVIQTMTVQPNRLYHVSFWYKSQSVANNVPISMILDGANGNITRFGMPLNDGLNFDPNTDWTQVDYIFASQSSTSINFYLGFWGYNKSGAQSGTLWLDDLKIEETALVNLLRRPGTPLRIYDSNNSNTVYTEGTDFNSVKDTGLPTNGQFGYYHTPPVVTLPAGSNLAIGKVVSIDSYSIYPTSSEKVTACLTETGIFDLVKTQTQILNSVLPLDAGLMMNHDEMRNGHGCQLCRAQGTAGQTLAKNVEKMIETLRSVRAGSPVYDWSDMFDPYHNAHDNYYLVEGDLSGSWLGLPEDLIVMNWNLGNLQKSLGFFAGQESRSPTFHRQIISGFYDVGDAAATTAEANKEMQAAMGIPGIQGAMYTTWNDDYDSAKMKAFADTIKANWNAYRASVPSN